MSDYEYFGQQAIKNILKDKTRGQIIYAIGYFGELTDFSYDTTEQMLQEAWRSDQAAGEEVNGIIAHLNNGL